MTALTDKGRLLFGAGFAFGVTTTLVILAMATFAVADAGGDVFVTLAAGAFFAGVVGATLFLLAFPDNRVDIPVERLFGGGEEQ